MCGIMGYIGRRDALPILLDGLRRLEYRGYDSAGVLHRAPRWIQRGGLEWAYRTIQDPRRWRGAATIPGALWPAGAKPPHNPGRYLGARRPPGTGRGRLAFPSGMELQRSKRIDTTTTPICGRVEAIHVRHHGLHRAA